MTQVDYRGARGANAGDDYHELWALRQALTLLDQEKGLTKVVLEGLKPEDETGTPVDTWDGVDCTLYFGGDHAASEQRIEIVQLKYSAANPNQAWTVDRLIRTTNKKRDNSVIARLAKAFVRLKEKRLDLVASRKVVPRLVSNQPADPAVVSALSGQSALDRRSNAEPTHQSTRAVLATASGLQSEDFDLFASVLDLSECGHGSRFGLEVRALQTISEWTDDDARTTINNLMRLIRLAMMPEGKNDFITRQSVLAWMGVSDPAALLWIVDRWGIQNNPWRWDDEPRKRRLSGDPSFAASHSHGSLPALERFHTYLEWHAMWCATGELMQTRALAPSNGDNYYTFEHRLSQRSLTDARLWLADLRSMKPLESHLWRPPQGNITTWVENVGDHDFLGELGLFREDGSIIVGGHHDTRSGTFSAVAKVETGLVSSDTAAALVRALQTIEEPWDYRIPPAAHTLEIDAPPYKLKGWLFDRQGDTGFDQHDPLRYGVGAIECCPSNETSRILKLAFVFEDQARWVEARSGKKVFVYEAWGDTRDDERDDRRRYEERVRSSGWRLRIDKESLRTFLNRVGLDLIVEVEITRGNDGYDYSRHDKKEAKEGRFDKVFLLRRDGTIETAEGRLGTWTSPGARTGLGGPV